MKWQPMYAAPRETNVIVYGPNLYPHGNNAPTVAMGRCDEDGEVWSDGEVLIYPTHWMPLPEPPTFK